MQYVGYLFFRVLCALMYIIPFWLIYLKADFLYYLMFYVVRYRKKVVYNNLRNSFPQKTEVEINLIAKKFYRHLCDLTLESIKGFGMTKKQLLQRYRFINPELLDNYFHSKQNFILAGAHYNNWEWPSQASGLQIPFNMVALYKPLSNKYIDDYIKRTRKQFGMALVPINETRNALTRKYEKPTIFVFIADQNPSNKKKAVWVQFLNRKTACLHGLGYYATNFKLPIVFAKARKIKRGYYTLEFSNLIIEPHKSTVEEVVTRYMNEVEKQILDIPQYWLWSHKRWKYKFEDVDKNKNPEND